MDTTSEFGVSSQCPVAASMARSVSVRVLFSGFMVMAYLMRE
jgi:hypothetical protein